MMIVTVSPERTWSHCAPGFEADKGPLVVVFRMEATTSVDCDDDSLDEFFKIDVDHPSIQEEDVGDMDVDEKRVRFQDDDTLKEVFEFDIGPPLSEEEKMTLWWTPLELGEMKYQARKLSRAIRHRHEHVNTTLSYIEVLQSIYAGCVLTDEKVSLENRLNLWLWITYGHSRRGLERWIVPTIGRHRRFRRQSAVRKVLCAQDLLSYDDINVERKAEVLRETYERYSKQAHSFATALGEADAVAALEQSGTPITTIARSIDPTLP